MSNVYVRSVVSLVVFVSCMAAALFLPAWTLSYWRAWVFLAVYAAVAVMFGVYLIFRDRALLERRMSGGPQAERRTRQRVAMSVLTLGYAALFIVPALDHRFGWSAVPGPVSVAADVLFVAGMVFVLLVFRENTFTSSTIEVASDQRVISTGPYAIVRHPMYSGFLLSLVAMPVALGSWWGLLVIVPMMPALVWRTLDEESMLRAGLPGYVGYSKRIRYRLLPGVW